MSGYYDGKKLNSGAHFCIYVLGVGKCCRSKTNTNQQQTKVEAYHMIQLSQWSLWIPDGKHCDSTVQTKKVWGQLWKDGRKKKKGINTYSEHKWIDTTAPEKVEKRWVRRWKGQKDNEQMELSKKVRRKKQNILHGNDQTQVPYVQESRFLLDLKHNYQTKH